MAELKPLGHNVIVRRIPIPERTTASGVIIPNQAPLHHSDRGKAIAVGPKCRSVRQGDVVLFGGRMKADLTLDGQDLLCIPEDEIIAILPGEAQR